MKVSVVILNYNGGELTARAIKSVLAQKEITPEIIVIDNGSTDGSRERLEEEFSGKILLKVNPKNYGFAPACNQGFELASGEWVALLNNDAWADPRWLKTSLERAEIEKGKIGIVVPKIIRNFERDQLDGIGVGFYLDGLSRAKHRGEVDSRRFDLEPVYIPSGCACLLNKEMIKELKGFDPDFFIYSEDTDLGIRAYLRGWRCLFEPRAVVYHSYSQTTSAGSGYSSFKLYQVERNRLWILFRYYPWYFIIFFPFFSLLRYINQVFSAGKGAGNLKIWSWMGAFFRAYLDAFLSFPEQLRWRREWLRGEKQKNQIKELLRTQAISLKEISRLD